MHGFEDFKYGIIWMDFQHEELLNQIADLSIACEEGSGEEKLDESMSFLGKYIKDHLALEELYMEKLGFNGLEKHHLEHRDFEKKFRSIRNRHSKDNQYSPQELLNEMAEWALEHVSVTDRVLADFLLKKEVK